MSLNLITCPECEDQLPPVLFNPCGPELRTMGLLGILVARPDQPFANIEDPAEHTARTSDTSTDPNAVRRIIGTGSFDIAPGDERPVGRLTFYGNQTGTLALTVFDNNDTNYELIQLLGCNTLFSVWLLDTNGYVYGGNSGYKMVLVGTEPITDAIDDYKTLNIGGTVEFKNALDRDAYPLAGELDGLI